MPPVLCLASTTFCNNNWDFTAWFNTVFTSVPHLFLVNWKYLVFNVHSSNKTVNLYEILGKKESFLILLILGSDPSFCLFHKIAASDVLNILRHQVLKERDVGW